MDEYLNKSSIQLEKLIELTYFILILCTYSYNSFPSISYIITYFCQNSTKVENDNEKKIFPFHITRGILVVKQEGHLYYKLRIKDNVNKDIV